MNRNLFRSIALVVLIAVPVSAFAQSPNDKNQDPREMLEGAARMMFETLEWILDSIPQYEAPEILENGDIIIRRKPKKQEPLPESDEVERDKT